MIEIKMQKCVLYFTEAELQKILANEPQLWAAALKRGKAFTRAEAAECRQRKKGGG